MNLRSYFPILALLLTIGLCAVAQGQASNADVDERSRLMQEYMARRAEWVEVRKAGLEKVKRAKDEKEKKQHADKLAEEERPYLEKMHAAGQAFQAFEKDRMARQEAQKPGK